MSILTLCSHLKEIKRRRTVVKLLAGLESTMEILGLIQRFAYANQKAWGRNE